MGKILDLLAGITLPPDIEAAIRDIELEIENQAYLRETVRVEKQKVDSSDKITTKELIGSSGRTTQELAHPYLNDRDIGVLAAILNGPHYEAFFFQMVSFTREETKESLEKLQSHNLIKRSVGYRPSVELTQEGRNLLRERGLLK